MFNGAEAWIMSSYHQCEGEELGTMRALRQSVKRKGCGHSCPDGPNSFRSQALTDQVVCRVGTSWEEVLNLDTVATFFFLPKSSLGEKAFQEKPSQWSGPL